MESLSPSGYQGQCHSVNPNTSPDWQRIYVKGSKEKSINNGILLIQSINTKAGDTTRYASTSPNSKHHTKLPLVPKETSQPPAFIPEAATISSTAI